MVLDLVIEGNPIAVHHGGFRKRVQLGARVLLNDPGNVQLQARCEKLLQAVHMVDLFCHPTPSVCRISLCKCSARTPPVFSQVIERPSNRSLIGMVRRPGDQRGCQRRACTVSQLRGEIANQRLAIAVQFEAEVFGAPHDEQTAMATDLPIFNRGRRPAGEASDERERKARALDGSTRRAGPTRKVAHGSRHNSPRTAHRAPRDSGSLPVRHLFVDNQIERHDLRDVVPIPLQCPCAR